ncbi:hypothetical protein, partial [Brevibacterium casei]|uniref:hypothetical protein n=1 Tax=Brevibacterium casei TaxID=33889 RepID=UPI001C92BD32
EGGGMVSVWMGMELIVVVVRGEVEGVVGERVGEVEGVVGGEGGRGRRGRGGRGCGDGRRRWGWRGWGR